ncbi:Nudix hydrolase 12 [Hibiscus syriacus]|uniref:Nudix hydrolase 12 n=1 Tax=Hibiscus syriacus TaxID=106335 RepID=A0A6A3CSH5_HIBSY|nr:Nudix hydrolase 12 [Hibiscus syriacus]
MSFLPARKGRHKQRYEGHLRLVAGCIPYRFQKDAEGSNGSLTSRISVLMISTSNRDDLVFPKGGWEDDETVHEAARREALEEAGVKGILDHMPLPENLTRFNCDGRINWESGSLEARVAKIAAAWKAVAEVICLPWRPSKNLTHGQNKPVTGGNGFPQKHINTADSGKVGGAAYVPGCHGRASDVNVSWLLCKTARRTAS